MRDPTPEEIHATRTSPYYLEDVIALVDAVGSQEKALPLVHAAAECGLSLESILLAFEMGQSMKKQGLDIVGVNVRPCSGIPQDEAWFVNRDGKVVGKMTGIGKPVDPAPGNG